MVLAFLRAELDSPRFGKLYRKTLKLWHLSREGLVDHADLKNASDNIQRRRLLAKVRDYGVGKYLFRGFPSDVLWYRMSLRHQDIAKLRYANLPAWVRLSGGTRRIADGANNVGLVHVNDNINRHIEEIATEIEKGRVFPDLICADALNGQYVLIEGHARATAYELSGKPDVFGVVVGVSKSIREWCWY